MEWDEILEAGLKPASLYEHYMLWLRCFGDPKFSMCPLLPHLVSPLNKQKAFSAKLHRADRFQYVKEMQQA